MMDKDILFTLAEIAVALAGFSAIIGVLGARKGATDLHINSLRLQVMLETCFMVAAASLIPVLIEKFGLGSNMLWRLASAAFLCMAIPFEFIAQSRTKNLPNMTVTRMNINTVNWGLSIGADLILVAILFNVVGDKAEALFLVALFLQLSLAGVLFVQFAAETFAVPDQDWK